MNTKNTFASVLLQYRNVYDLEPLFSDFLDLCLIVLSPSALAGFPLDRERFESILLKYADPSLPLDVSTLVSLLLKEMRCQVNLPHQLNCYSDVLGDFYEEHILRYDPDMPFSSWDLDEHRLQPDIFTIPGDTPARKKKLLDGLCGSGRRLLARRWMHTVEGWYGMEITPACAKMAILNLFLHHLPEAEIVCVSGDDAGRHFLFGYAFSRTVTGIRELTENQSWVWQTQVGAVAMAA